MNSGVVCGGIYGNANICGGKVDIVRSSISGRSSTINIVDGEIETINLLSGGSVVITGGRVTKSFLLANNSVDIDITIGDLNLEVNQNNPVVTNMSTQSGDLAGIVCNIRFYNGMIIQDTDGELGDSLEIMEGEITVRSGYNIKVIQNTITGKYEYILQEK